MNEQKSLLVKMIEVVEQHYAEQRATVPEQDTRCQQLGRLRRFLRWLTPNGGTLLLIAVLLLTQNVWARQLAAPVNAPGPSATTVNYQGRLADSGGTPLDGTYGMSFSLWDAATDGSLVWGPESHTAVPVSEGLFSAGLGSQTSGGIPTTTWNGDRYLEITVGGETLAPRELIRSVPIAGMALAVPDGSITDKKLAWPGSHITMLDSRVTLLYENPATTNDNQWHDLDISAHVSSGATAVILQVGVHMGFVHVCPLGQNQSDYLSVASDGNYWQFSQGFVKLTNGHISYKATTEVPRFYIRLIGYVE